MPLSGRDARLCRESLDRSSRRSVRWRAALRPADLLASARPWPLHQRKPCRSPAVRLLAVRRPAPRAKCRSGRGAHSRAAADRPTPVSRRDGLCLTLSKESRIGLAVVAHHQGPVAEMDHLHHVRVTRRGCRMVVIPPVHRRCRARGNERRTLLRGTPGHDPPAAQLLLDLFHTLRPLGLPCGRTRRTRYRPVSRGTAPSILAASRIRPVRRLAVWSRPVMPGGGRLRSPDIHAAVRALKRTTHRRVPTLRPPTRSTCPSWSISVS